MRISDWSSDVCSSDLTERARQGGHTVKRSVIRKSQPAYASHKWAKGQRFDRRHASNYRVIDSPRAYHLRPAPRGHQWVRSGNDAVLIAIGSGIISAIIANRSEEHTSELQSLMRISYAVFCLKKKKIKTIKTSTTYHIQKTK